MMETDFTPFDWERLFLGFQPHLYLLEVALRCLLIYCLLLVVMRMMGKRGQGNLSPMQQILLIALGSAAGDVLLYPTVPFLYAALILVGVTGLTLMTDWLSKHSAIVRHEVESEPRLLVTHGKVNHRALRKERTSQLELYAKLRVEGARSLRQVEYAILEVTGDISVFLNDDEPGDEDLLRDIVEQDARASSITPGRRR